MHAVLRALPVLLGSALTTAAGAQTVTVTTTADSIDIDPSTGTVADLPGPDGLVSFSEAMIATNNTPGHQTVGFAIPVNELGWCCPQYNGIAVFHSNVGFYWRANDEVTIDGTTQTAFAGDTNPDGAEVLLYNKTFYLNDDNSTLRGFHGTAVQSSGVSNLIEDNTGQMNLTLFAGGGSLVRNNDCGTIKIDRSDDNVLVGNTTTRVRVYGGGTTAEALNNRIGGPTLAERNFVTGYGTHNSEGLPAGAAIHLVWTRGTSIENNWIGTTPDGLQSGNTACTMGINIQSENHDVTVRDNRIAGILGVGQGPHHAGQLFGWAIYFWGSTTNVLIEGNTIGLDANGDPTLGSVWGINVDNFSFYTVHGVSLVDNAIAGHLLDGIRVGPTAQMRLSRNAVYANGWLGIDLIPNNFTSGVSPNDPLDVDEGGNGVQNFPTLSSATLEGGGARVAGTLHSSPLDDFTLEFFASSACDPAGHGQGEVFLGSTAVTTDGAGDAAFDVLLPAQAPAGWSVVATATIEPLGVTSEFSACVDLDDHGEDLGTSYCGPAVPNSSGASAVIRAMGSDVIADNDFHLVAEQLPRNQFGYFLTSMTQDFVANPGGSQGNLCLGGTIGRFAQQVQNSGGAGEFGIQVDLTMLPPPLNVAVQPGETWNFTAWYRDMNPTATSNFTDGRAVLFL